MFARHRLLAALLAFAPLGACAVVQEKTLGQAFDDASASGQVKARLINASTRVFNEVDVEVAGGLVLLSGRVPTEADRIEAERITWSVNTIDEVANEIIVIDQSSVISNVNDEWITARVRARLTTDKAIKGVNFNIETFNGAVYLLGLARSEEELRAAATHASEVRGVKKVVSYVKLRYRDIPDFQPEHVADSYNPTQDQMDSLEAGYSDPYADPYGDTANGNPYSGGEYSELTTGY